MRLCSRRAHAFRQIWRWVGLVQHQTLDQWAKARNRCTFAAFCHLRDHVRCQLQVPAIVKFAGFHDRTTGIFCRAAAFEGHGRKRRLRWVTVVRVGFHGDHVVRAELGDNEWAGADWAEVRVCTLRCFGTKTVCELCRLDDWAFATNKRAIWVWRWRRKVHNDSGRVWCFNRGNAFELGHLRTATFWVGTIVIGEFHIRRSEVRAVRPFQTWGDVPGDGGQVRGHATIRGCWDLIDQPRDQLAILVVAGQRLDDHGSGFNILGTARQERVQDGWRLPIDDADIAVASAFSKGSWRKCCCSNCSH